MRASSLILEHVQRDAFKTNLIQRLAEHPKIAYLTKATKISGCSWRQLSALSSSYWSTQYDREESKG